MTVLACTYSQREVDGVEGKRFEQIIVTVDAGIAEVTLNRPDRYNALGSQQGLRYETAAIRATLSSEDYKIGLAAFAEKRTPEFPRLTSRRIT